MRHCILHYIRVHYHIVLLYVDVIKERIFLTKYLSLFETEQGKIAGSPFIAVTLNGVSSKIGFCPSPDAWHITEIKKNSTGENETSSVSMLPEAND